MTANPTGSEWTVLVAGEQTGGRIAVIETRARRGATSPCHVHSREDEVICVIDGRVTLDREGERLDAAGGTCVYLPRGSEHGFRVESDEARLLVLLAPAGLERSLDGMPRASEPGTDGQLVERLVTAAARYGVTITGARTRP